MTLQQVLDAVLGPKARGKSQKKNYDVMTPSRYIHLAELARQGVSLEYIEEATQRIHASGWLKKFARDITEDDLTQLRRDAPWNQER